MIEDFKVFPFDNKILKNLIEDNKKIEDLANYSKKISINSEYFNYEQMMEDNLYLKKKINELEAKIHLLKAKNRKLKTNEPNKNMNISSNDEM